MMRASLAIAALAAALLAGCATVPGKPVATEIVATPSRQLVFSTIRAEERDGRLMVRGKVARRTMMRGAVWGHLHVEALSGARVVGWADTRWSQLARRRLPRSSFFVQLPVGAAGIDQIRVSHQRTGHGGKRRSGPSS